MKNSFFSLGLGRDFWSFRAGQLVSILGDSCGSIALAWWILDKTGSAAEMSSVIAPAMVMKIFLLPIFGPLADRYSRKHLIFFADLWRFAFSGLICAMVYFDFYYLPALLAAYACLSMGTALFSSAAGGIVPQLVDKNYLQTAIQQSRAIDSFGSVAGGIVGGVVVSVAGVFGAFLLDTASYALAAIFTIRIKADTRPRKASPVKNGFCEWRRDFTEGFAILFRIPVLFWLCLVAMFLNLALSPLSIILPVLAKESRNMPPWFLGALESSVSLGAILGAMSLNFVQRLVAGASLVVLSLVMIGVGVAILPWVPNAALPVSVLFFVGLALSWANIVIGTQVGITVPSSHLGRIGGITGFMCNGISPLGVALAGLVMAAVGLQKFLVAMGLAVVVLSPLIFFIPHFRRFLAVAPGDGENFFAETYPGAFRE